jgi:hypothetical protein
VLHIELPIAAQIGRGLAAEMHVIEPGKLSQGIGKALLGPSQGYEDQPLPTIDRNAL